jgi:hypothetical protein
MSVMVKPLGSGRKSKVAAHASGGSRGSSSATFDFRPDPSSSQPACYDRLSRSMTRALITFVVVLFSAAAGAQTPAPAGGRWHGEAVAPLPGLPKVSLELGEPGPYVSTESAVLDLQATAGEHPFNGYIGYHFAVGRNATLDVPVVSRVVLPPHGRWSLRTQVRLQRAPMAYEMKLDLSNRELVIEWRDRSLRLQSQQTVGTPPWTTPRPLRVTGSGDTPAATPIIGQTAQVRPAGALSDRAQWYLGFSAVAMPVAVWLDLPLEIRQALFGSSIRLLFFGVPRREQTMSELDRAAIPVTFQWTPGSYTVPWPYAASPTPVTVPVSWQADPETRIVGPGQSPYLVANKLSVYAAEERALARPIPGTTPQPVWRHPDQVPQTLRPTPPEIVREYLPAAVFVLVLLLSLGGWLVVRRTPRLALLGLMVAASAVILAMRGRIRPIHGLYVTERTEPVAPGVVRRFRTTIESGETPIAELPLQYDPHTTIGQRSWGRETLEVVTAQTAPAQGTLYSNGAWDAAMRRTSRQELAAAPSIRIRSRDAKKLVLDYQSPIAVDYLFAGWSVDGRLYQGQVPLDGAKSGSATVESSHTLRIEPDDGDSLIVPAGLPSAPDVVVSLVDNDRQGTHVVAWAHPIADRELGRFRIGAQLVPQPDGTLSCLFALPPGVTTATANIGALVDQGLAAKRVTLTGPSGSFTSSSVTGATLGYGTEFASGALKQIAPEGGIIQLIVELDGPAPSRHTAYIDVSEKKQ